MNKLKRTRVAAAKNVTCYTNDKAKIFHADVFEMLRLLPDNSINMVLADLPYGVTACKWDAIIPMDLLWKELNRVTKENAAMVFTATQPFAWQLCASNPDQFRYELIWEKPNGTNPMLVKKQPFRVHESILVFYRKQPTYNPQKTYGHGNYAGFEDDTKTLGEVYTGGENTKNTPKSRHRAVTDGSRYPRSVQKFAQDRSGHPTKKPVDLFQWLIRSYSNKGDLILDPTIGEGTTAVAALKEKRRVIGCDVSEEYIARAVTDVNNVLKEG